jgi:hypothetical protein
MTWIIIIVLVFVVGAFFQATSNMNEFEKRYGKKTSDLQFSSTYVSGHPELDNSIKETYLLFDTYEVKIFKMDKNLAKHVYVNRIQKEQIKNVAMENSTTVQTRVGVKRLLAVGIFAFAWKKKEKLESAYIVVEWNDGQFEHETIFEFEGNNSINQANTLKNKFIAYLK